LINLVPVPAKEFEAIPQACIGDSDGQLHYVKWDFTYGSLKIILNLNGH